MKLRREQIDKPSVEKCFHYFDDARDYSYVGAIWKVGGVWFAFCCTAVAYGPVDGPLRGGFASQQAAERELSRRALT